MRTAGLPAEGNGIYKPASARYSVPPTRLTQPYLKPYHQLVTNIAARANLVKTRKLAMARQHGRERQARS